MSTPDIFPNLGSRKYLLALPQETHAPLLICDSHPQFSIIGYSYRGESDRGTTPFSNGFISLKTEFWGETFYRLCIELIARFPEYTHYSFVNSDVLIAVSDYNKMFQSASLLSIPWFQPSLSRDSFYSHEWTLHRPGLICHLTEFCEIMVFTLPAQIVRSFCQIGLYTISGWGIDCYLLPYLLSLNGFRPNGLVFDSAIARHCKPVESSARVFSNGLTASQEMEELSRQLEKLKIGPQETP